MWLCVVFTVGPLLCSSLPKHSAFFEYTVDIVGVCFSKGHSIAIASWSHLGDSYLCVKQICVFLKKEALVWHTRPRAEFCLFGLSVVLVLCIHCSTSRGCRDKKALLKCSIVLPSAHSNKPGTI